MEANLDFFSKKRSKIIFQKMMNAGILIKQDKEQDTIDLITHEIKTSIESYQNLEGEVSSFREDSNPFGHFGHGETAYRKRQSVADAKIGSHAQEAEGIYSDRVYESEPQNNDSEDDRRSSSYFEMDTATTQRFKCIEIGSKGEEKYDEFKEGAEQFYEGLPGGTEMHLTGDGKHRRCDFIDLLLKNDDLANYRIQCLKISNIR